MVTCYDYTYFCSSGVELSKKGYSIKWMQMEIIFEVRLRVWVHYMLLLFIGYTLS